jgi:hypothetical protein
MPPRCCTRGMHTRLLLFFVSTWVFVHVAAAGPIVTRTAFEGFYDMTYPGFNSDSTVFSYT